jgi:hypothetical protein
MMAVGMAAGCAPMDAPSDLSLAKDSGTDERAWSEERGSTEERPWSEAVPVADAGADFSDVSTDASSDRGDEDAPSDPISQERDAATYVKGIVGVGYGGLRIVSRDQGRTWGSRAAFAADGVDDENLLRAVVYGKGLWIATGWKLVTSNDGVHWTDRGLIAKLPDPRPSCNVVEGLAFKEPTFYAACAATLFRSDDGLKWTPVAPIGDTGDHLFLTYRAGQFIAYGDTKTSFRSVDGLAWSILPGIQQASFCGGEFRSQSDCGDASWFDGVYLRPEWKSKILRSTDGAKFDQVYLDDMQNTVYQGRAFAEGYVSP